MTDYEASEDYKVTEFYTRLYLAKCPDCGAERRADQYNRSGWYWLECDRRYNPDLDEYSHENSWCKLNQLQAEVDELREACLEFLKAPPSNVPARRKFAEIVTGGSCDHLDEDCNEQ